LFFKEHKSFFARIPDPIQCANDTYAREENNDNENNEQPGDFHAATLTDLLTGVDGGRSVLRSGAIRS
jgi:hypothetical protein